MAGVTIDNDFRIEIPEEIREALQLQPGQEVGFVRVGHSVRLVKVRTLNELRGTLKGDWSDYRDEEDEPR